MQDQFVNIIISLFMARSKNNKNRVNIALQRLMIMNDDEIRCASDTYMHLLSIDMLAILQKKAWKELQFRIFKSVYAQSFPISALSLLEQAFK
jgi:hypothetical protein